MSADRRRYDAVVFDMDGVLVERSPSWVFADATEDAFGSFGLDPDPADVEALSGLVGGDDDAAAHLRERFDVAPGSLLAARETLATRNQVRAFETGEKRPYDDAQALLAALDRPAAVVSNNAQTAVELVVRRFGFADDLRTWYGLQPTPADAARRKPDSAYLSRALSELSAGSALYVGDRASDVETACNASVDGGFVHRSYNDDEEFDVEPAHEFDGLAGLAALLGLPESIRTNGAQDG